ncbi:hypothetical protein [Rhizobium rhizogenes]|uniref:Uncharacterized protein n=1 Tax=Rhizobium rhizogenes NBRC 13257 TaxID=1220581 RepID=A0AA87QEQ0_RHIRH|nr:hypothetical protein [Rhizobium rhizogenes]NTG71328.1 hypothetical protein [Rhizobium rhizogenes]TRB05146.1 hypothetical protein EXN67_25810 [Rhizobium rhizogenes]TRB39404.1 hypothetical protein EXN73_25375 [Rhizobium rhizogenes]TRB54680.1 hypothetical protein EXN71_25360 [Rhizobium rhizogenes]GAJ95594.1 hypothetical protein RRH01S_12_01500 [Rhizobium rhizogenes NBRC 13257]
MSVVVAAIIAGATAGITKVGGEIVSDLYKALKGKIAEVAQLDLSSIEEQPEDTHERMALEGEVKGAKLDTVAAVIEAANRVIEATIKQKVPMDDSWLVDVETLVAKKDIIFRDMDTEALLLKARSVRTNGQFVVEGIKQGRSRQKAEPLLQVGHLQANSVSVLQTIINAVPNWLKIVIVVGVSVLIVKFGYDYFSRRAAFDAAVERVFSQQGDGYMSSVNSMLNLQASIRNTRDNGFWTPLTAQWSKHIGRLEGFFEPIATGLTTGTMSPAGSAQRICPAVENVLKAHYGMLASISKVPGISVNFSAGTGTSELSIFGPVVSIPSTREIEVVYVQACDGDLETIKNPPDLRTAQEKRHDTIGAIDEQIEELRRLKQTDITAAREKARSDFVSAVARSYIRMGMYRVDAIDKAEQEYDEVYNGSGSFNYLEPGINDAVDRIKQIKSLASRDFDGEIKALEAQKSVL